MFAYVESEFERYHVGQKPLTSPSSGDLMGLLAQVFQSAKFFEIRPIRGKSFLLFLSSAELKHPGSEGRGIGNYHRVTIGDICLC